MSTFLVGSRLAASQLSRGSEGDGTSDRLSLYLRRSSEEPDPGKLSSVKELQPITPTRCSSGTPASSGVDAGRLAYMEHTLPSSSLPFLLLHRPSCSPPLLLLCTFLIREQAGG